MSSIGNWGYQDNFQPVYLICFYKKISRAQKHSQAKKNYRNKNKQLKNNKNTHKQKQNNKTKISKQKTTKAAIFCAQRLLRGRNHFCWVWYFLFVWNLFVKKKIKNRFKIALIASITYTTNVYTLNPPVTYLPSHFHLIHFIYQSSSIQLCTKVQLIHFTNHSPSHSHSPYLVLLILHHISTFLCLSFFFNQSRLWKPGVSLDETLTQNIYCIIWSWTRMVLLLLVTS